MLETKKMTIIYTGGTFDVLHAGHINFFRTIKRIFPECELIVSLNTDGFIERYKKKCPVFDYKERKHQIQLCGYVDKVVENTGGEDSKPAIKAAFSKYRNANKVIAIGSDWLSKDYCKQMQFSPEWLQKNDISLIYIPYTLGVSTSQIKERINKYA